MFQVQEPERKHVKSTNCAARIIVNGPANDWRLQESDPGCCCAMGGGCPYGEPSLGRRHWPRCHSCPGAGALPRRCLGSEAVLPPEPTSQTELDFPLATGSEAAVFG